jgi:hypothetical protein
MDPLMEAYLDVYEEFVPLTPDKEKKVQSRVGELARDIQVSTGNVKSLRKKPLAKFRPEVKKQISSNISSAKTKQKLVQNASDALIRSSIDREASTRSKINQLKNQLGDLEGKSNIRKFKREELEYILDVLVSEGFVNNYDSAHDILEAMSDEWLGSLLSEAPFDIYRGSTTYDGVKVGSDEPVKVNKKPYKTKKGANRTADKLNQEYGAGIHRVVRIPEP